MAGQFRTETDSQGEIQVPADALYGAQTARALENFRISDLTMPRPVIAALARIKAALAMSNRELGLLEPEMADAIITAALAVADGDHDSEFPVDVFQTGSGTSTNMNANEVIAHLASHRLGRPVHPNDHVNMGQSSNDVIPAMIHVSAAQQIDADLLPALTHLADILAARRQQLAGVVKTGRTHLMDALPLTFDQEISAWESQVRHAIQRVRLSGEALQALPLGGTAIGTGLNADPALPEMACRYLGELTGITFHPAENAFEAIATQDAAVALSGQLKTLAVSLMKICNDLRWMNSGPLAGLGEISLPVLQPGSSIMPGKVNPVIPEAVCMVCAQVIGNDLTITVAGQSGNFQLNVMLPVIAWNLTQSLSLLASSCRRLADGALRDFSVNQSHLSGVLARNPVLITALNAEIGYDQGARIAKKAYAEGRSILEVAREMTDLDEKTLARLLDPVRLTKGGILK